MGSLVDLDRRRRLAVELSRSTDLVLGSSSDCRLYTGGDGSLGEGSSGSGLDLSGRRVGGGHCLWERARESGMSAE